MTSTTEKSATDKIDSPLDDAQSRLAFTMSLRTFAEFLAEKSPQQAILRERYREVRVAPTQQMYFTDYPDSLNFVVIVGDDSPDVVAVLPLLARIAAQNPRFQLWVVRYEDDLADLCALVDGFDLATELEDVDLPLLLLFDEEWQYQEQWGPRPQAAEERLAAWLEDHPEYANWVEDDSPDGQRAYLAMLNQLIYTMRIWYNSGLNRECVREIYDLLVAVQDSVDDTDDDDSA